VHRHLLGGARISISAVCPCCSAKLKAPHRLAGRRANCPKCQEPFRIPARASRTSSLQMQPHTSKRPARVNLFVASAMLCFLLLVVVTISFGTSSSTAPSPSSGTALQPAYSSGFRSQREDSAPPTAPRIDPRPALPPGKQETSGAAPIQDTLAAGAPPLPGAAGNKTVHVSGYTRSTGTYVSGYDRAAPGTATSRGGFGTTGHGHGGAGS
jgi:hypothetical protein